MSSTPLQHARLTPLPIVAFLALPLLLGACATENNDSCLGVGDPNATLDGGGVTLQSAVVPQRCLPDSLSGDTETP